jgi:hypothetical protein
MRATFLGQGYIIEVVDANDSSNSTSSYSFLVTPWTHAAFPTSTARTFANPSRPNSEIHRIYAEILSFLRSICHHRWRLLPTFADYNALTNMMLNGRSYSLYPFIYAYCSVLTSIVLNMTVSELINIVRLRCLFAPASSGH